MTDSVSANWKNTIATILADLPEEFCVINGLMTPFGDLDQLIVGPIGVYVLDAKNWKGVVAADGRGELLVNGRPTDKRHRRQFRRRPFPEKPRHEDVGINDDLESRSMCFLATEFEAWCARISRLANVSGGRVRFEHLPHRAVNF